MPRLADTIKSAKAEKEEFAADIRKDFAKVRDQIPEGPDRIKFDAVEQEVIGGFARAIDSLISLAPIVEKYGIK